MFKKFEGYISLFLQQINKIKIKENIFTFNWVDTFLCLINVALRNSSCCESIEVKFFAISPFLLVKFWNK